MKKILFASVISVFCMLLNAQNMTDAANFKKYANANVALTKQVVFIGNSITEGWVNSNSYFFSSNNYIGRGISGQTSSQLLLRFRQDVINLRPLAVVINIGTNDIAENTGVYSPQLTMDNIQSMAELAEYNGIRVILSSVLPVGEYPWRKEIKDVPQKIDALNVKIKAYAENKGFAYIDYNTPMREVDGAMKIGYGRDGVHPSKEGYSLMESIAKAVIDKVIEF